MFLVHMTAEDPYDICHIKGITFVCTAPMLPAGTMSVDQEETDEAGSAGAAAQVSSEMMTGVNRNESSDSA
ncbi:hypothetical protein [Paenibacillus sp. R14(2021)]|uniref:hypothetical protein n=1 Tax=Paenibacillus sp. R14(2021) TaxID=2859228 RepID=UPI001C615A0D|nr:hypothetical protein [Paenibacillus sp. R14(2021)]